jgi:hypothetical protein
MRPKSFPAAIVGISERSGEIAGGSHAIVRFASQYRRIRSDTANRSCAPIDLPRLVFGVGLARTSSKARIAAFTRSNSRRNSARVRTKFMLEISTYSPGKFKWTKEKMEKFPACELLSVAKFTLNPGEKACD